MVGGIVGEVFWSDSRPSVIENCHNTGNITGAQSVGGVAGYIMCGSTNVMGSPTSRIMSSTNSGTIISVSANAGGIAGYASGAERYVSVNTGPHLLEFASCENYGAVSGGTGATVGGIAGGTGVHVLPESSCANTGSLTAGSGSPHQLLP